VLISTHSGLSLPPLALLLGIPRCVLNFNGINMTAAFLDVLFPKSYLESRPEGSMSESFKMRHYRTEVERDLISKPTRLFGYLKQLAAVLFHFVSASRLRMAFKNIKTLAVTGTEDCVIRPINSYKLALHTGGQLKLFHEKGHMLHDQAAPEFNELLEAHISAARKDSLFDEK
jgi:pimeloyl-ACP methyl ester carboxylesterase